MFASSAVFGQETLTIYQDATGTSSYVPIIGGGVVQFIKCEFVIPASQLEAMEEGTISQMTFHQSKTANLNGDLNFQVFLKEVDNPLISSYYGTSGATIVYEGSLDASQSMMEIAFTTNYTYHGGNLLVGVYQIQSTYFYANIQFWGQTVSGACVQGNGNSLANVSCTQRNFIPKTTFTYTPSNNTCPKPKNLTATNVANNSATLSWTQKGDVDHWDVFYTDSPSYVPVSNTHPQFANIGTNPFTLTGLPVGRTYYAYVRANCGNEVSEWSDPCVFTLAEQECTKPTNLVASGITTNAAILSWTAIGDGQNWEIQYKKADETNYIDVAGTITNPYTLQGLEPSHGYLARVRAVCGNDSYSDWLETTFFTDCNPITLPYIYGFEDVEGGDFPPCWSRYSNIGTVANIVKVTNWGAYSANSGTHALSIYHDADEFTAAAVLPQIPVDAQHPMNGNEMVFYAAGYWTSVSCQVGVMTDPNDPATFVLVENIDIPNNYYYGVGFRKYRVSFSNYSGNGTYIAIRRVKTAGEDSNELIIDDVEVHPIPDCSEPTDLTVTATTSTTATLQWTANGGETSWHIQYKRAEDEWPDTYQIANQNPFTLEGLTPGTAYKARVRAVCAVTETSDWTDYASILTPFITPYYEDLESYLNNPSFLDKGWQYARSASIEEILTNAVNLEENPYSWQFGHYSFTDPSNGMLYFNDYIAHIYVNMANGADCLITPSIELGEGYQLSFDLGLEYNHSATSGLDDNRFAVLVTDDNGASWNLLALWDNDGTQGRTYYDLPEIPSEVIAVLPNTYDNETVRFAFCAESTVYNNGTNHLYLDNVNVTKCIRPDLIVASNITTNSATLDWTTHGESSWTLQYRLDGTDNWTTVSGITTRPYNLTGLVAPNNYLVRVKAHNANGESEWSNCALFVTECSPISLSASETYEQYFNGIDIPACWSCSATTGVNWTFGDDAAYNTGYYKTTNADLDMPQIVVTPGLCLTFHHSTAVGSSTRVRVYATLTSLEIFTLWDSDTDDLSAGVTTISLNEYVGQTMTITFNYNGTGVSYFYIYDVTLANLNTFTKQTTNGYWNETANWSAGNLPGANESVAIAGEATIPNDGIVQVDKIQIAKNGSLTIADGGQLQHNNTGVEAKVQKNIAPYTIEQTSGGQKPNGWYLIASPMQDAMQPSETMLSNAFDLYRFNQSAAMEWENYQQHFYLSPYFMLNNGCGYLYANDGAGSNTAVTIELEGQLRPGSEELEIPLSYDASAQFAGWNLMGNPFANNVTSYTSTNVENGCFRMNATHDDLMVSEISAADPLQPMEGFFVKATDANASITFNASKRGETNHESSLYVELSENGKTIDRLIVKGNEQKPLEKFSLNQRRSKIFATRNQQEMSIVSREGDTQPVNFKAEHDGTYTLTVSATLNSQLSTLNFNYLHLIDNLTGNDVNLLTSPSYTFKASVSDYESRFSLVFFNQNENDNQNENFAFIHNGEIIITGIEDACDASLQVIDMLGRVIVCRDAMHCVSTVGMAPGVYTLRLINGDKVKTQKIVIE